MFIEVLQQGMLTVAKYDVVIGTFDTVIQITVEGRKCHTSYVCLTKQLHQSVVGIQCRQVEIFHLVGIRIDNRSSEIEVIVLPVIFRNVIGIDQFNQRLDFITRIVTSQHPGYHRTQITHGDMQFPLIYNGTNQPFQSVDDFIACTGVLECIYVIFDKTAVGNRTVLAFTP